MKKITLSLIAVLSFGLLNAQSIFKENFENGVPGAFTQNFVNGTLPWTGNYGNVNVNLNNPYFSGDSAALFYIGAYSADETELISPTMNMAGGAYYLDFWHLQEEWLGDQNTLAIFVSNNGGSSWVRIDSITGDVPTWTNRNYFLSSYISLTANMQIKFKGFIDWGYAVGIDSVDVYAAPTDDIGVTQLISPTSGCGLTSGEQVQVQITNFGTDTAQGFSVSYKVDALPAVTESFSGMILPGQTATHTFAATANLGTPQTYSITSYTTYSADLVNANDTLKNVQVKNAPAGGMVVTYNERVSIPDSDPNGVVTSVYACGLPTQLGACLKLKSLTIDSIIHTFNGDLNIFLISPWLDTVEVSTNNGGGGADYISAVFTDTSQNPITGAPNTGPITGVFRVEEVTGLSKFHTLQDPNGEWKVFVYDDAGSDTGSVYKWTLEFEMGNTPVVALGNDTNICETNSTVFLDAGFGANYTYNWSNALTSQTQIVSKASLGLGVHTFYVDVTDTSSQCASADTITITVSDCVGLPEHVQGTVKVMPIPASDQLTVVVNGMIGTASWEIVTIDGRIVRSDQVTGNSEIRFNVDVKSLTNGMYLLRVKDRTGTLTKRLTIQH